MPIKKIYLYIAKNFLTKFFLVAIAIAILAFVINLFDILDKAKTNHVPWLQIIELTLLQVPSFIEDVSVFLVILSTMITLFVFSIKSEVTIMKSAGLSFWNILLPIILTAFMVGVFFITVFNPVSILASKKFNQLEQQLIEKEEVNLLAPTNGIWLKQENINTPREEIVIRADKIYRKDLCLLNVSLWFFDKNQQFYKKIDAKSMLLSDNKWQLQDVVINDEVNINQPKKTLEIPTNLKSEFIAKKILNNFEDEKLFSIYDLPGLISDLKASGFSPRKFVVYYNSLLNKPFLFVAMVLIAGFFAVNNVRNRNNVILFVMGIMSGLILYTGLIIVNAFGASGLIPTFLATWTISIILLSLSVLLIFRKEVVN